MTQPALLLHHYDTSPFSEKIRKVLAHKRLAWGAVEQPSIMPKPDLIPLTGGYRRIPVLQIGADVDCDTQCIVRVLERVAPDPTIYPDGTVGTAHAWNLWADRLLFLPVVAVVFADIGSLVPPAFIEDRSKMMPGRDFRDIPKQAPHAREQVRALVATLAARRRRPVAARQRVQPGRRGVLPPALVPARRARSAGAPRGVLPRRRLDRPRGGHGTGRAARRARGRGARGRARRGAGRAGPGRRPRAQRARRRHGGGRHPRPPPPPSDRRGPAGH